ncbi:hypothetical protein D020_3295B, partial [Vibrio parahaemolyticus SBR10290]
DPPTAGSNRDDTFRFAQPDGNSLQAQSALCSAQVRLGLRALWSAQVGIPSHYSYAITHPKYF